MPAGGKRSTTWTKGNNPVKKKGTKHRSTKIKEAFGITKWDELTAFVEGQGLERLTKKMDRLRPKDYCMVFMALTEFVKPKLQRTTHVGDPDKPVEISIASAPNVPREELLKFLSVDGQ